MFRGAAKASVLGLFIGLFASFGGQSMAAENATITGDGVNVREQPSVWLGIYRTFDKGKRVEVVSKTDFSDTIGGFTAPWYELSGADGYGYVFGQFIKLDPGVTVPSLDSSEPYSDPMFSFIEHGLEMFGGTRSAIIKKLGQPVSRKEERYGDPNAPGKYIISYTLMYRGIVFGVVSYEGSLERVYRLSLTTSAYVFNELTVGSTVADVERVLGPPTKIEGETHFYYTRYYQEDPNVYASFTITNGKVIEIVFFYGTD